MHLSVDGVRRDIRESHSTLIQFVQHGAAAQQVIDLYSQPVSSANASPPYDQGRREVFGSTMEARLKAIEVRASRILINHLRLMEAC